MEGPNVRDVDISEAERQACDGTTMSFCIFHCSGCIKRLISALGIGVKHQACQGLISLLSSLLHCMIPASCSLRFVLDFILHWVSLRRINTLLRHYMYALDIHEHSFRRSNNDNIKPQNFGQNRMREFPPFFISLEKSLPFAR